MTSGRHDPLAWLDDNAEILDRDTSIASELLPRLAATHVFRAGLAADLGGTGGAIGEAVDAIAAVSYRSMAAGFVAWGHRTFIEYLVQSPNEGLRRRLMPQLLSGALAGATGLSNAMKFLSGIEGLSIVGRPEAGGLHVDGKLPWVTNLRPEAFVVAAALSEAGTDRTFVVALPSQAPGLRRSPDLDLMAMRASNTAAVDIVDVVLGPDHVLTDDARTWLPQVRPAFLGMQCGMAEGLARRALDEARASCGPQRHVLRAPIDDLADELDRTANELRDGLRTHRYVDAASRLFELRIRLAEIARDAVSLELQAAGGRAYLHASGSGFQRRSREAAFVPIITPSLVQLKTALADRTVGQPT